MRRIALLLPIASLFIAFSGFDCASTQMTTAKLALQRRDYAAAAAALEKEVALRPNGGDAWLALAEVYELQERIADASHALVRARAATEPKLTALQLEDTYRRQYNLWRTAYNHALLAYGKADYARALAVLDTAQIADANKTENLFFRATIYEDMKDQANATKIYQQYVSQITPFVEQGAKLGLALNMTPAQVEAKLGKPTRAEIADTNGGYYYYAPRNIYVYFAPATATEPLGIEGWRSYDESTPESMRALPIVLHADPYAILGENARAAKDYDNALRYLQTLSRLDPGRTGVASVITQIYIDTKRVDQAIRSLRDEMAANPKDPRPYIELGNLYFGDQRLKDAADAFEQVTNLGLASDDQNLRTALFNLGAVYKNWSKIIQDSVKEVSKGKPTAAQNEAYYKPLRESAKYFEQYRKMSSDDFAVLAELANLYDVLGNVASRDKAVRDLEALAPANRTNYEYWRAMSKLYAILGDVQKSESADKRAGELK